MKPSFILIITALTIGSFQRIEAAKILAVFSFAGPSQYILVQPYLKALAGRGHEVTVINAFPQKTPIKNFRDIPVLEVHDSYKEILEGFGATNGPWNELENYAVFTSAVTLSVLNNAKVQDLMNSNEKFDLVIVEALMCEPLYAMAQHFGAILMGLNSYGTDSTIDEYVGNTSPVSYIPLITKPMTNRMTFWERLDNMLNVWLKIFHYHWIFLPQQVEIYKKYFPEATADLNDIRKNFSLILSHQHFSLSFPRPLVPNMIEVGGFHINHKPSPLPEDMDAFINGAEHGVIYFSMGSNVKSKDFPPETQQTLLRVFGSLKQRVIWKFEEPQLPGKPDNVFISKWCPQPDILAHPNVKLFITHCGLLSTIEAIYHAKPVIGVPVFYDQHMNILRAVAAGFGLHVNFKAIKGEDLKLKIDRILNDPSFTNTVQAISRRYHDQPMKPLDTAIWWTEYVLRHQGAPHMRVAAQDLTLIQYHSVDTIGFLLAVIAVVLLVIRFVLRKLWSLTCGKSSSVKRKQKRQ